MDRSQNIGLRISELVDYFANGVNTRFADIVGTSEANIRNYRNGKMPKYDFIYNLCSKFEINCEWLITGNGEMLKSEDKASNKPKERAYIEESVVNIAAEPYISEYNLRQDYYNIAKQQIPLYEIEASAGLNLLFANQSQQIPIDYISVPNAPKCDGALFVRGDSMYPLLKSGDIVCYKHIKDILNNIRFGEIYLLYINDGDDEYLTLKYVHESERGEEYIKLVSENRHHSPKNEHISHIKAVALVKLSIRYNTIS